MKRKVSIVIPLLNEEQVVQELYARLSVAMQEEHEYDIDIVFVDDGSTDATLPFLIKLAESSGNISVISLSRNFGHQAALSAGLDFAQGEVVVLMDGDLQDPPELIHKLLRKYEEGYDVVYIYRERRDGPLLLRASYFSFYRLLNVIANFEIPNDSGDYCLLNRAAADALRSMPERHRFLRGMRAWTGFRQAGIPHHRPTRAHGESKYSFRKLLLLALDGLFSFSTAPLRIATVFGSLSIGVSLLLAFYWLYARVVHESVPSGFAANMLIVVFLAGVQFLLIGIIGEYVGRVYEEVKKRPLYMVKQIIRPFR